MKLLTKIDSTGNISDGTASIGQTGKYDTCGDGTSSGTSESKQPVTSENLKDGAAKIFIRKLLQNGTNKYDPKTTSSLNKYIHENYGSALTVEEMAKLSGYLGLNYGTGDLETANPDHSKFKMKILKELKLQGFSKGGIVKDLEDAVKANGDSVIVSAQPGEAVLTKEDTENLQRFTKSLKYEELSRKLEKVMHPMPDLSSINAKTQSQEVLVSPKETFVKIDYGNVDINFPNVMDYADFVTMAQHDPKFERLVTTIMRSDLTGKNYLAKNSIIFNH